MASSTLYRRYLQVISRWPLDPNKQGRDLGVYIRSRIGIVFPQGEFSKIDDARVEVLKKEIEALEKITSNANKNLYSNIENSSPSTGIPLEVLSRATSSEVMDNLNSFHTSTLNRIKLRFISMFK